MGLERGSDYEAGGTVVGARLVIPPTGLPLPFSPSYSPHSRDSLVGMVQSSGIA